MTNENTQAPQDGATNDGPDQITMTIASIMEAMRSVDAQPAVAAEALAFILGRVIAFASTPGQIDANIEGTKASILRSVAAHAAMMRQAEAGEDPGISGLA